jgi:hypothetical protein
MKLTSQILRCACQNPEWVLATELARRRAQRSLVASKGSVVFPPLRCRAVRSGVAEDAALVVVVMQFRARGAFAVPNQKKNLSRREHAHMLQPNRIMRCHQELCLGELRFEQRA